MQRFNRPKYDEEELGMNPFTNSLVIKYFGIPTKEYEVVEDGIKLNKEIKIENEVYTKLFTTAENRVIITRMSSSAKSLLLWICYEIDSSKDFLWINRERYMLEAEIKSNTTYLEAVKELVRYGFIIYSTIKDVFWINPSFIFKGNRIKKYPNNLKKVNE